MNTKMNSPGLFPISSLASLLVRKWGVFNFDKKNCEITWSCRKGYICHYLCHLCW